MKTKLRLPICSNCGNPTIKLRGFCPNCNAKFKSKPSISSEFSIKFQFVLTTIALGFVYLLFFLMYKLTGHIPSRGHLTLEQFNIIMIIIYFLAIILFTYAGLKEKKEQEKEKEYSYTKSAVIERKTYEYERNNILYIIRACFFLSIFAGLVLIGLLFTNVLTFSHDESLIFLVLFLIIMIFFSSLIAVFIFVIKEERRIIKNWDVSPLKPIDNAVSSKEADKLIVMTTDAETGEIKEEEIEVE